jgi:RNA polymerase sigma factor (sigma-70 family)
MTTDGELLRRYAESASEEAFGELVRRHLDLVYSAALRQVNRDAPMAQDVAQSVFADLAGKARSLKDRAALAGWLYTSTHYAAAKAVRAERRRQNHEQEAHAMQEILRDSEPGPDWEACRPVLDAAMHELSEPDREVILLRYFQNRPYAEIGEQIGLGENAARMRAERALEKLRAVLARNGVTTTAAIAAALSANSVTAAPAGLASAITTTATLAGTASAATAIAATTTTKAIIMTPLLKTLCAAVLAASLGAGIYKSVEASRLRLQNQALQQQQTALAGQLQALQRQHNETAKQLAALQVENQRLSSAPKSDEVLKLRGQVGKLRQALSNVSATNRPSSGIAKLLSDPAMKEYLHQAQLKLIKERYAPLFQELKLTPEDADKFTQLVSEQWLKVSGMASAVAPGDADQSEIRKEAADLRKDAESQLKALLGEAGYARYNQFTDQIPAQTTVKLLNGQLGDNALSVDQSARLLQIVQAEPYTLTHGIAGDLDVAFFGSQEVVDGHLQQVAESNQRILDQAAGFLSAPQLAALATLQSNSFSAQKIQGAALVGKH